MGTEDGRLPRGSFRASSFYNVHLAPYQGKLNSYRSWTARQRNVKQWLQVDLLGVGQVTGIATQGRRDAHQWVTSYVLSYSKGSKFRVYRQGSRVKLFRANSDRNTVVYHMLKPNIVTQAVRIHPKRWRSYISMRVELYGWLKGLTDLCNHPIGMQNGRIKNSQITSSSLYNRNFPAWRARLKHNGAWMSKYNNHLQWLQVDMRSLVRVTMVSIQGNQKQNSFVRRFRVVHSLDGVHQVPVLTNVNRGYQYFYGNHDSKNTIETLSFKPSFTARFVRIYAHSRYRRDAMRLEIHGCRSVKCDIDLGAEDKRLPDVAFTASSKRSVTYPAYQGRLNYRGHNWVARHHNRYQWLQVDLGNKAKVIKVASQGNYHSNHWVRAYTIKYGMSIDHMRNYKEAGRVKVFLANYDRDTIVYNTLRHIWTRYVRFRPTSWHGYISMRVELYGCSAGHLCNRRMGMESGSIRNGAITASSQKDAKTPPYVARLRLKKMGKIAGGWIPKFFTRREWIQIDTGRISKIIRIATQAQDGTDHYVTRYYLSSSVDGVHFSSFTHNSIAKAFTGNRDRTSVKFNSLLPAIKGRFLRITPYYWHRFPGMRVELYGCKLATCSVPIGLQDGRIPNTYITASSKWGAKYDPHRARLNHRNVGGYGAWSARYKNAFQWIQIRLLETTTITGIATQGRYEANQWVKTYEIATSYNGKKFRFYSVKGKVKLFQGNFNRLATVSHRLVPRVRARYVRIYPKTWYSHISMRIELYGCSPLMRRMCYKPLGIGNGRLPDANMRASSVYSKTRYAAKNARLGRMHHGKIAGAWAARHNNHNQWLQVNLGRACKVVKVATQGRTDAHQWVTQFQLKYSTNSRAFQFVKDGKKIKMYKANIDRYSIVENTIDPVITAKFVRFIPRGWRSHISMRVEVYGCYSNAPSISRPNLTPTIIHRRGNARVVARCHFRILNRKRRTIISVVQFFVNRRLARTVTVKRFHADLIEHTSGFKAGTTVSCRVKSRYAGVKEYSNYDHSPNVFFGIKVHPKKITISEKTPWQPIKITGFVPIGCYRRSKKCKVVAPISNHDDYVTDKCVVGLTDRTRKAFRVYVKAVKDFKKSGKKRMALTFGAIRSRPGGSKFWIGYKLPAVQVL